MLTGVIENGDFSSGTTGWTVYNGVSTLSVSSGQLTIDRNGSTTATGQCVQVIDTVPGKGYAVTLDVVSHTICITYILQQRVRLQIMQFHITGS